MLKIKERPRFSELTTLRIGGNANAIIEIYDEFNESDLNKLVIENGNNVFVLGAGSNILASDEDLNLVLLKPKFTQRIDVLKKTESKTYIGVSGNVRLGKLIGKCASLGLSGLEGLCGIPGTVGGAIAMNAGSFDSETCAQLESIKIYSPATGIVTIESSSFNYAYRSFSIEKINSWFFVIYAIFSLTNSETKVIKEKMFLNFFKKKSTQPVSSWSAGCLFKNPADNDPAGKLLEMCGFKGKSKGGMGFSSLHANFLINEGNGNANAAFELIEEAREEVNKRFGCMLTPEVKILCP